MVDFELAECERRFAESIADAEAWQRSWQKLGTVVVADTNVYLHYPTPFDQIDWPTLMGSFADGVTLVVPLLVIDELDKAKRLKSDVRTRARDALKLFEDQFQTVDDRVRLRSATEEGFSVYVRLLMDAPGHVRLPDPDTELIDRALELQNTTSTPVTFASGDTGAILRARSLKLLTLKLETPNDPTSVTGPKNARGASRA
jgi:predicted ribonuclease YlaK